MLSRDLRRDDGFTLPEMMISIVIAVVISMATFALISFTIKRSGEIDGRVDSAQRGRLVMDTVTRQLRSQVCVDSATPSMATRAGNITDNNTATFYVDFTSGQPLSPTVPAAPPELHTLAFNPTTRQLVESDYTGTWTPIGTPPKQTAVYGATPVRTKVLATNVAQVGTTPVFQYYAFNTATPPALVALPLGALTVANLAKVASITVTFRSMPKNATSSAVPGSVVLTNQVFVRAADPNAAAPTPTCA